MQVIIGIDPHKAHTAVAVSGDEGEVARLKVRREPGTGRQVGDMGGAVYVADVVD